jgi:imidazolonepropionase-like amidohydrolase
MDRKEKYLNVRVYPIEKRALEIMCNREGLKTSEMLREVIREAARARGINDIGLLNTGNELTQDVRQPV